MILPLVSELLARIARLGAIEEMCDRLRRNTGEVRLAGLTESAKALVAPLVVSELVRPAIVVVESNQHAEALIEPMKWFYRAVTGKPERRVALLPALDVSPYENRSPHGEIAEDRAVALWRLATGEADILIAPAEAALARMREPQFYRGLARTIARDESIAHDELIGFLARAGYERQTTCEMPGQFAVRGGIIDVFSPETPQPVRIELLGDTIESIRAFDPNTQRSTNPMERALLLPLTEFLLHAEVLEHQRVAAGREDAVQ
ncbi:MAG: transcription-repair coupling factor, partial [Acidobacteriota bacterium]|nr:transcription-repair coupling factor [Acidobacteriota bacterium]